MATAAYTMTVNGGSYTVEVDDPTTPLLYILQENLQLNGPKFGCGLGQCGCCTVIMGGQAIRSCITPISSAQGQTILTVEGLGTIEKPHPIQQAFIDEQAMHCGYCLSGPMLYGYAYIQQNPNATEADILNALSPGVAGELLCRCYVQQRMMQALLRYAHRRSHEPHDVAGVR